MARRRSGFGNTRKLPSGRWQARYVQPGTDTSVTAPCTFESKIDAKTWLSTVRSDITRGAWMAPDSAITFRAYAATWLAQRRLKPRTREHYAALLAHQILPAFGDVAMQRLTPPMVRDWHAGLGSSTPTQTAHAYSLLKSICATAVDDDLMVANPARIRGAGTAPRAGSTEPASLDELALLVAAMPERYKVMTLLAAWCGLRFGELTDLRGKDVDTRRGAIKVRHAVVRAYGQAVVDTPKSGAGVRDVAIPPHLLPMLREHVLSSGAGRDGLLFPSASDPAKHMQPSTLYKVFYPARLAAGRPDLRWHDLRHTGATLAAATGATLAELMTRMGHSTPSAALRYQHSARGRDKQIAEALSRLADDTR